MDILLTIIGLVIAAAVTYGVKVLKDNHGIVVKKDHAEALQKALEQAATYAVEKTTGTELIDEKQVLKDTVQYVIENVPDAVEYYKKSPAELEKMAISRIAAVKKV